MNRYIVPVTGELVIDAPNAVQALAMAKDYRVIGAGVGWRSIGRKGDSMHFEKHHATLKLGKIRRAPASTTAEAK